MYFSNFASCEPLMDETFGLLEMQPYIMKRNIVSTALVRLEPWISCRLKMGVENNVEIYKRLILNKMRYLGIKIFTCF